MFFVGLIDSRLDTAPFHILSKEILLLLLLQNGASFTVKEFFDARSCEWHIRLVITSSINVSGSI
jgi:hypothetical protein